MTLLRFVAGVLAFISMLAGIGAVVLVLVLLLRFPLLLLTLICACWVFTRLLRHLSIYSLWR